MKADIRRGAWANHCGQVLINIKKKITINRADIRVRVGVFSENK